MELTKRRVVCNKTYEGKIKSGGDGLLTFFTPSYNRAKFLHRLAECVEGQTCKDFVWIIVNDGSKDNTDDVVYEILNKERVPLMYISKSNGGKHSAFKVALENCQTSYFQCMDDDDLYDANAVNFFLDKWKEIKSKHLDNIGAIRTLARRNDGSYSTNFPITEDNYGKEYIATTLENNYIYHRIQENWTCYDTEKLKSVDLFPTDYWLSEKHKFFDESIWQSRFARQYSCLYVNMAFREYRDDDDVSLMRRPKSHQYFVDRFINAKMVLEEQYDYISKSKVGFIKRCLILNWYRSLAGIKMQELYKHISNQRIKRWLIMTYPTTFLKNWFVKRG